MARHTRGPWSVGADLRAVIVNWRDESGNLSRDATTSNGWAKNVAKIPHGTWASVTEHVANAKLIAAAPDLLEALETVWDAYGFDPSIDSSIWQTVLAAIAKAKGENQ